MITTTPIAVRFDNDLIAIIDELSEMNHTTKADFIRQAVLEKIEDMNDIALADTAYQKWIDGGKKTYSHDEMMKRYG